MLLGTGGVTADYEALYKWSIAHLGAFWAEVWEWESGDPGHGEGGVHRGFVASRKWDEVSMRCFPFWGAGAWGSRVVAACGGVWSGDGMPGTGGEGGEGGEGDEGLGWAGVYGGGFGCGVGLEAPSSRSVRMASQWEDLGDAS